MKVLVCGSRDWDDADAIRDRLRWWANFWQGHIEVIHGAARGADQLAASISRSMNIPETAYPADWPRQG